MTFEILGLYQTCENTNYLFDEEGNIVFYRSVLAGGLGGIAGQLVSSPAFLVKTHLQTQANETIAVGHQHQHGGMTEALRKIYREQGVSVTFFKLTAAAFI